MAIRNNQNGTNSRHRLTAQIRFFGWSRNGNILEEIEKRKKELALYANVTNETVIGSAARAAFGTIADAFDDEGDFVFSSVQINETG